MASRRADRCESIAFSRGQTGSPLLFGSLAYIECVLEREHDAGNHVIVIGRVVRLEIGEPGGPLLFYRGCYEYLRT